MRYAVAVLWYQTQFPKVIEIFPLNACHCIILPKFETVLSLFAWRFRVISVGSHCHNTHACLPSFVSPHLQPVLEL